MKMTDAEIIQKLGAVIHDMVVANQAAWIEWQHGKGAEAAMQWIENGLFGPGFIPDEDAEFGKDAQLWYSANRSDPFPRCGICGLPSNTLWMGNGACGQEHMDAIQAQAASAAEGGGDA